MSSSADRCKHQCCQLQKIYSPSSSEELAALAFHRSTEGSSKLILFLNKVDPKKTKYDFLQINICKLYNNEVPVHTQAFREKKDRNVQKRTKCKRTDFFCSQVHVIGRLTVRCRDDSQRSASSRVYMRRSIPKGSQTPVTGEFPLLSRYCHCCVFRGSQSSRKLLEVTIILLFRIFHLLVVRHTNVWQNRYFREQTTQTMSEDPIQFRRRHSFVWMQRSKFGGLSEDYARRSTTRHCDRGRRVAKMNYVIRMFRPSASIGSPVFVIPSRTNYALFRKTGGQSKEGKR